MDRRRDAFFWVSWVLLLLGSAVLAIALLLGWPATRAPSAPTTTTTENTLNGWIIFGDPRTEDPDDTPYHDACECPPCVERAATSTTTTTTLPVGMIFGDTYPLQFDGDTPYHQACDCPPCLERVTTSTTLLAVETPRFNGDVATRCRPKDFDAIYRSHVEWFDRHPWRPLADGC